MEPIKRKKSPLEQAYQHVADGFSGKKEVRCSYYEPIFVLDEEWNILKQQEQESTDSPLAKEQISNQRAKRERVLARGFEASPYAKREYERKEAKHSEAKHSEAKHSEAKHSEAKQSEAKQSEAKQWEAKQWEALKEQLRINPRIGLNYTFQVAQQRLFEVGTFCPHTPLQ